MTKKTFEFDFGREDPSIEAAVFQAIGAASVAWIERPANGEGAVPGEIERVFDDVFAKDVGEKLIKFIEDFNATKPSPEGVDDPRSYTQRVIDYEAAKSRADNGLSAHHGDAERIAEGEPQ